MTRKKIPMAFAAVATLLASGCVIEGESRYVGGGTMPSAGGSGPAVMTVNVDTCGGEELASGRITYADRTAIDFEDVGGVSLRASVLHAGVCEEVGSGSADPDEQDCICPGWPSVVGEYESTNPAAPGGGKFRTCFWNQRDQRLSGFDQNTVLVYDVSLVGGPYAGYVNHGTLSGNIQRQECDTGQGG